MSRKFGSYVQGYFHYQMETAAKDCLAGNEEITKLWGEFLDAFYPVAYAISSTEAGAAGRSYPIKNTIREMHTLQSKLNKIKKYIQPYEEIMNDAIDRVLKE
jgi:hypothetical protein